MGVALRALSLEGGNCAKSTWHGGDNNLGGVAHAHGGVNSVVAHGYRTTSSPVAKHTTNKHLPPQ